MPTKIITKNGSGAPDAADLEQGELAVDLTNKRLYTEDAGGSVIEVGTSPSTIDINAGSIDGVTLGTNSAVTSAVITTADINGGTLDNVVIGGSTPAAGTFTSVTTGSLSTTGDITFGDNDKAIFGAGSDLQIYHDGSNSYVQDAAGTGDLILRGANVQIQDGLGDTQINVVNNDKVVLSYNANERLETTATGIDVTGSIEVGDGHTIGDDANDNLTLTSSTGENIKFDTAGGTTLFFENGSEVARISSGQLGIGKDAPAQTLHIKGDDTETGSSAPGITIEQDGTGDASINFLLTGTRRWLLGVDNSDADKLKIVGANQTDFTDPALTIDVSGNVGIGTSSPDTNLEMNLGTGSYLQVMKPADNEVRLRNYKGGDTAFQSLSLQGSDIAFRTGTAGGSSAPEAMRIDSSGQVGINVTPAHMLHIQKSVSSDDLVYFQNTSGTASDVLRLNTAGVGTGTDIIDCQAQGSSRFRVDGSGQVIAPAVYNDTVTGRDLFISSGGKLGYVSSIRESKDNIVDLSTVDWLYQLNPVQFQYRLRDENDNYTGELENQIEYGLIAEDVEAVNSDLVFYDETENGQELRGVQYSRLIAPLIKAVKDQKTKIETLEAEKDAQATQIADLVTRIEALEGK